MEKIFKSNKPKIKFLDGDGFGNAKGDVAGIVMATEKDLYYYDSFKRYCYVEKSEEGKSFEYVGKSKEKVN